MDTATTASVGGGMMWGDTFLRSPEFSLVMSRPTIGLISPSRLVYVTPATVIGVYGTKICAVALPNVTIGGYACTDVFCADENLGVIGCTPPPVVKAMYSLSGYPMMPVVVTNVAGAKSRVTATSYIEYPTRFEVSWNRGNATCVVPYWPSSRGHAMDLIPNPQVALYSEKPLTCGAGLFVDTRRCYNDTSDARVDGPGAASLLFGISSTILGDTGLRVATFAGISFSSSFNCTASLGYQCRNTDNREMTSQEMPIASPELKFQWADGGPAVVVAPGVLPPMAAELQVIWPANLCYTLNSSALTPDVVACAFALVYDAQRPPTSIPLISAQWTSALAQGTAPTSFLSSPMMVMRLPNVDATAALLNSTMHLHAECTWLTGERILLPSRVVRVAGARAAVAWTSAGRTHIPSYAPVEVVISVQADAAHLTSANASCHLDVVATQQATVVRMDAAYRSINTVVPANGAVVRVAVVVQGQPYESAALELTCTIWGRVITSEQLPFTIAPIELTALRQLPAAFMTSDTAALPPATIDVSVMAGIKEHVGGNATVQRDVTCSIALKTDVATGGAAVARLMPAPGASSDLTQVRPDERGVVAFAPFFVRAAVDVSNVTVLVTCLRDNGVRSDDLTFVMTPVPLRMALCDPIATSSKSQTALPAFAVGIAAAPTHPCSGAALAHALPPISCQVLHRGTVAASGNASAETTAFFQHGDAVLDAAGKANFTEVAIIGTPGAQVLARISCSIGVFPIPPAIDFSVSVSGCSPGTELVQLLCRECPPGLFSLGGADSCRGCPTAGGAVCANGLVSLLPNVFIPPRQAKMPLGPDTQVLPCFNGEACTSAQLDGTNGTVAVSCSRGYSGPLCGVCDESVGFARSGQTCAACWSTLANSVVFIGLLLGFSGALTFFAMRPVSGQRKRSSIALRLLLGYVATVGALKSFKSGYTRAYRELTNWTDAVSSSSPLGIGSLQCLLRPTFLTQYLFIVLLPVVAAVLVVVTFIAATAVRHVRCGGKAAAAPMQASSEASSAMRRRGVVFDVAGFQRVVTSWWAEKRHIAAGVFLLTLAYMPAVSASLKALDCSVPIDGVRYVVTDLSVPCGEGDHAIVRVLSYVVIACVGVGFPVAIFWVLASKSAADLADHDFHAKFGFLYDGYRFRAAKPEVDKSLVPTDDSDQLRGAFSKWFTRVFCPRRIREHFAYFEAFLVSRPPHSACDAGFAAGAALPFTRACAHRFIGHAVLPQVRHRRHLRAGDRCLRPERRRDHPALC